MAPLRPEVDEDEARIVEHLGLEILARERHDVGEGARFDVGLALGSAAAGAAGAPAGGAASSAAAAAALCGKIAVDGLQVSLQKALEHIVRRAGDAGKDEHVLALNGLPRVLTDAAAEHDVHAVLLERAGDRRMTQILGRDDLARDRIEIRNVVDDKLLGAAEMLQQNAVLIRHCDLHNSNSFAFLILRIAYHNFHHSTTGSFLSSLCKKLQSGPCVRRAFSLQ